MPCTAFEGCRLIAAGPLGEVALVVRKAVDSATEGPVHIYDDATGRVIDLDPRGSEEEVLVRLAAQTPVAPAAIQVADLASDEPRGRGRPKLGVLAREVTLLPRHWDWLNTQPGGASIALRKLVEEARRTSGAKDRARASQEAAYRFMSALAGDLPGFEEASRALFAHDRRKFGEMVAAWPEDVRDHAIRLAFADLDPATSLRKLHQQPEL